MRRRRFIEAAVGPALVLSAAVLAPPAASMLHAAQQNEELRVNESALRCEVCLEVVSLHYGGASELCNGFNAGAYVTCVEVLESLLHVDPAVAHWQEKGCLQRGPEGLKTVVPCPAPSVCRAVPSLFPRTAGEPPKGLDPLCPQRLDQPSPRVEAATKSWVESVFSRGTQARQSSRDGESSPDGNRESEPTAASREVAQGGCQICREVLAAHSRRQPYLCEPYVGDPGLGECVRVLESLMYQLVDHTYWIEYGCERIVGGTADFVRPCPPAPMCGWLETPGPSPSGYCLEDPTYRRP